MMPIVFILSLLIVCATTDGWAGEAKSFHVGYGQAVGSAMDMLCKDFSKRVTAASEGELKAQCYPAAQLGKARDFVESLQLGSVEMHIQGDALATFVAPEWALVLSAPFVIRDLEHLHKVMDGPTAKPMYDALLARKGIRHLGWLDRGPRYLTSNRPIKEPADLKGLKLRVQEIETHVWAWKTLGATVVPMDFAEVFLALTQGTIHAQENPLEIIYNQSVYQAQKYINQTAHQVGAFEIVASEKWLKTLSAEQQKVIAESVTAATATANKIQEAEEARYEKTLREKGVIFNPVDRAKFEEGLKDMPKVFSAKWKPGFYETVKSVR